MAIRQLNGVIQHLRRAVLLRAGAGLTNGTSLSPEALQRSAGTEVCNNTLFSDIAFLPQHFSRIAISLPVYSDFGTRSAV
jgi:hypothetical protein